MTGPSRTYNVPSTPTTVIRSRRNEAGQTVQRVVDESGGIVERTLNESGEVLDEAVVGDASDTGSEGDHSEQK